MQCNRVFFTVRAKGNGAGRGGGDMAALILNLDNIWKRPESHLVALCLAQ